MFYSGAPKGHRFTYDHAIVSITSSTFRGFSAASRGGAVDCRFTQLSVDHSIFQSCSASSGGCLYLVTSSASISASNFASCKATYTGGAVAATEGTISASLSVAIAGCRFVECSAHEFGGAVSLAGATDVLIDASWFSACRAGAAGAAIALRDTHALVFRTTFHASSGTHAVWVASSSETCGVGDELRLATDGCCFASNARGDIALSGAVHYQSFSDRFANEKSAAVRAGEATWVHYDSRFAGGSDLLDDFPECVACVGCAEPRRAEKRIGPVAGSGSLRGAGLNAELPAFSGIDDAGDVPRAQGFDVISGSYIGNGERTRTYLRCVVHVLGSSFTNCSALGGVIDDALGGSLYASESQLLVSDSVFDACMATVGGALGAANSIVYVRGTAFRSCRALFKGGSALLFSDREDESAVVFQQCNFTDSGSREQGGGLTIVSYADATIDGCRFEGCRAEVNGGAVEVENSSLLVFRSHFVRNVCGGRGSDQTHWLAGMQSMAPGATKEVCGGGAIHILGASELGRPCATEYCCFVGNRVDPAEEGSVLSLRDGSFDVFIGGTATYQSFDDRFLNWEKIAIFCDGASGAAMRSYHTRFYGAPANEFFPPGHECSVEEYMELAYSVPANVLASVTIAYTDPIPFVTTFDTEGDTSAVEQTAYATRVPVATPLGQSPGTAFAVPTSLVLPHYSIHEAASGSAVFAATEGFPGNVPFTAPAGMPGFVGFPTPEATGGRPHFYYPHFKIFDVIGSTWTSKDPADRVYQCSIVHIIGCAFRRLAATGGPGDMGFGGALLVSGSQLLLMTGESGVRNEFDHCRANAGGAIAALSSDIICRGSDFLNNTAEFHSGSFLIRFLREGGQERWADDRIAFFGNCSFVGSTSRQIYGALGIEGIDDATVVDCLFKDCRAALHGGAIGAIDTNLLVATSQFVGGFVGSLVGSSVSWRSRLAGAIYVAVRAGLGVADHNDYATLSFGTERCCFVQNTADDGFDVWIANGTRYHSVNDRFFNYENVSISATDSFYVHRQTKFIDDPGFLTDHECGTFAAAYDGFQPSVRNVTSKFYDDPSSVSIGATDEHETSQSEQTPWATRVPPATPLGRTVPTEFAMPTNLSFEPHSIASLLPPPTPTGAFIASATPLNALTGPFSGSVVSLVPSTKVFSASLIPLVALTGPVNGSAVLLVGPTGLFSASSIPLVALTGPFDGSAVLLVGPTGLFSASSIPLVALTGPFNGSAVPSVAPTQGFSASATSSHAEEQRPSFAPVQPATLRVGIYRTHFRIFEDIKELRPAVADRAYLCCLVHVTDAVFQFMSAVGAGDAGFGGCLLLVKSQLLIRTSTFKGSQALSGGAICCLSSDVVCRGTVFWRNIAFFSGGSVVVQYDKEVAPGSYSSDRLAFFGECRFEHSTARQAHGALEVHGIQDATLLECEFVNCSAAKQGGAIGSIDTNLLVIRSRFLVNMVNQSRGGAVSFITLVAPPPGDHNQMVGVDGTQFQFATEDCCFAGNMAPDICLTGPTRYQSFGDRFFNTESAAVDAAGNSSFIRFHTLFSTDPIPGDDCGKWAAPGSLTEMSLEYSAPPTVTGDDEDGLQMDTNLPENTPWATRVPAATPLGRTLQTDYTIDEDLSVPGYNMRTGEPRTITAASTSSLIPETASPVPGTTTLATASPTPPATARATPVASESPLPDPTQGNGLTMTVSYSMVPSYSHTWSVTVQPVTVASETETWAALDTVTLTIIGNTSATVTQITIEGYFPTYVGSVSYMPLAVPIFVTLPSAVAVRYMVPETTVSSSTRSNAVVIGSAVGSAAVVALLAGAILFIVRKRTEPSGSSELSAAELTTMSTDVGVSTVGEDGSDDSSDHGGHDVTQIPDLDIGMALSDGPDIYI
jgi:hypothetical protein